MKKTKFFLPLVLGLIATGVMSCKDDDSKDEDNNEKETEYTEDENSDEEQIEGGKVLDGHHYVDLGLSVKWAMCNVGAVKPEAYGNYYAWGETLPKKKYDWSTYKYANGDEKKLTKYCATSTNGTPDDLEMLQKEDDAATVNWGGVWRTPTEAECKELIDKTNNYWTEDWKSTKIAGYVFVSKDEKFQSDTLFIPAAGSYTGTWFSDENEWGDYLMADGMSSWVNIFNFWDRSVYMTFHDRSGGFSVRPVAD